MTPIRAGCYSSTEQRRIAMDSKRKLYKRTGRQSEGFSATHRRSSLPKSTKERNHQTFVEIDLQITTEKEVLQIEVFNYFQDKYTVALPFLHYCSINQNFSHKCQKAMDLCNGSDTTMCMRMNHLGTKERCCLIGSINHVDVQS